jgi:4-diphosphocytidyl-2-C-methyl-D-erythritol kinase
VAVRLRAPAFGKVNLCLFLGEVRGDDRHELVTVFESVSLADWLVLEVSGEADAVSCPAVTGPNLVSDALAGLRRRGWAAPPVAVSIHKRVPVAAGMGGGSADAAAALRLAFALGGVPAAAVSAIAPALGADVPSQLRPGLCLGTGAGEVVEPLEPLAPHALVIVPLPYALSTPAVYREADRLRLPRSAAELTDRRAALQAALAPGGVLPAELMVNDLEPASRALCPPIDGALADLRAVGADTVFMCGSGPTCAGLWWGPEALQEIARAATLIAARYPGATAVVPVAGTAADVSSA